MVRTLAPIALAASLLAGCALSGHPRIADLKYNPGRYQDKTVSIDSWGIPLLPLRLYKVDDGTGEVTVVSHDGRVPARGARVSVRGRVSELAQVGGQSIGLHLEEEHLRFKY